jgi:NAD(P)-dependent dehydrogenase (short-subunit alcohol dehydrogenase family)
MEETKTGLEGRRFLITGAASGIGRATAELFAAENARLALVDLTGNALFSVAESLSAAAIVGDVSNPATVQAFVEEAVYALGGLDGIVNVAGITRKKGIEETTEADWAALIGVNLGGPFFVMQAAVKHLRRGRSPTIVNVSSGTALMPTLRGYSAYAASKGGLVTLSKALAFELAPDIRVNIVCPGSIVTGMMSAEQERFASSENSPYALRRSAQPIEVARGIRYLSCDESSYVTGTTLAIDGGRTFH